ncbi:hypothetical protein BJY00DRAFT_275268 [Aspergillus carlsbadensis]|nr:hypothetical protein BJY00DRAFT_275268 [Aspergillus carlsbadensis]
MPPLKQPPTLSPSNTYNILLDLQTKTLPLPPTRHDPWKRSTTTIAANTISIPSTYGRQHSSPSAGVIVGAVLGSVAGFLFLLYLLYLSLTSGRRFSASTIVGTSTTPSEIVDVGIRPRRRRGPGGGGGAVIVEESVTGTGMTESAVDDGGVVEVIEEDSVIDPPPSSRSGSRRHHRHGRYRSRSRSTSESRAGGGGRGYRRVDPSAYGGGESEFSGRS